MDELADCFHDCDGLSSPGTATAYMRQLHSAMFMDYSRSKYHEWPTAWWLGGDPLYHFSLLLVRTDQAVEEDESLRIGQGVLDGRGARKEDATNVKIFTYTGDCPVTPSVRRAIQGKSHVEFGIPDRLEPLGKPQLNMGCVQVVNDALIPPPVVRRVPILNKNGIPGKNTGPFLCKSFDFQTALN